MNDTEKKGLSAPTLILCSLLALVCGLLAQQIVETTLNTYLTLLPFNLKTV